MSDYETQPEDHLNFNSKEWAVIKAYLKGRQESTLSSLCSVLSQDDTNLKRGYLMCIRELLFLEQAAANSRQQEQRN